MRAGQTRTRISATRQLREVRHDLSGEVRRLREDLGISQRRLAAATGVSQGQVSRIEAGRSDPSLESLTLLAAGLGGRLFIRIHPGVGPPLRDHLQAAMIECLLRALHPRWRRFLEVPVFRPVRGYVDLALHDPEQRVVIAGEAHSQLRSVERQTRWANAKAEALVESGGLPIGGDACSRLLLLRSTRSNREIVALHAELFRSLYPAPLVDARASLLGETSRWPGAALLWTSVDRRPHVLDRPPRGITVGRSAV